MQLYMATYRGKKHSILNEFLWAEDMESAKYQFANHFEDIQMDMGWIDYEVKHIDKTPFQNEKEGMFFTTQKAK